MKKTLLFLLCLVGSILLAHAQSPTPTEMIVTSLSPYYSSTERFIPGENVSVLILNSSETYPTIWDYIGDLEPGDPSPYPFMNNFKVVDKGYGYGTIRATIQGPFGNRDFYLFVEINPEGSGLTTPYIIIHPSDATGGDFIPGGIFHCTIGNLAEYNNIEWSAEGNIDYLPWGEIETIGYFGMARDGMAKIKATIDTGTGDIQIYKNVRIGVSAPYIRVAPPLDIYMGYYIPGSTTQCWIENLPANSVVYWSAEGDADYLGTQPDQSASFGFPRVGTATFIAKIYLNGILRYTLRESVPVVSLDSHSTMSNSDTAKTIDLVNIYSFPAGAKVYTTKKPIEFNIENTNLKKGIYIIETIDSNGQTTREKVAKTY